MARRSQNVKIAGFIVAALVAIGAYAFSNQDKSATNTSNDNENVNAPIVIADTPADPNFVCYPRYVETASITPEEITFDVSEVQWYTIDQNKQIVDHYSKTQSVIVEEPYMTAMLGDDQVEQITLKTWNGETATFSVKHDAPGETWECNFTATGAWDITDQE